jgi:hypothetical protein
MAYKLPDCGYGIILKNTQEEDGMISAEACCGQKESISNFSDCRIFNEENLQRLENCREIIFSDLAEAPLFTRTILSPTIPRIPSDDGDKKNRKSTNRLFNTNPSLLSQDTPRNAQTNRNQSCTNISTIKLSASKPKKSLAPDWAFSKNPSLVGLLDDNRSSIGNHVNYTI